MHERGIHRSQGEHDPRSAILGRLEASVEAIQTSEDFRNYLSFQSRFHHYSFGNTLLILSQRPDATRVAGFRKWQAMDRFVMKGEKAIKIFVPMTKKTGEVNPETGDEEKRQFFGIGNVFDVSQTDGRPLPERVHVPVLESDEGGELYKRTWEYLRDEGITVEALWEGEATRNPSLMGYYRPDWKMIRIRDGVSMLQQTKTLLHETAHFKGGHGECTGVPRDELETEAESVAYVVAAHFGLDTGERSFPYIATWSRDKKVLQKVMAKIQQTSSKIIDGIERPQTHGEPGDDLEAVD
jgi:hypothetical protein